MAGDDSRRIDVDVSSRAFPGGSSRGFRRVARRDAGLWVIDRGFHAIEQAVENPRGRAKGLAFLEGFLADVKSNGFLATALSR